MRPLIRLVPILALAGLVTFTPLLPAQEVQHHGIWFERWVCDTFFDGYRAPIYTQKWDIPAAANKTHGGIPVNPKAAKFGAPVDLGDALRQFDIDEPFLLVIGYWRQEGDAKRFVNLVAARVEPAVWRSLWGPVTRADLEKLDAVIKDRSTPPELAREAARKRKSRPPYSEAVIVLNPKIDAKRQRRLQCSLRAEDVFRLLAPDANPAAQEHPMLWGVELTAKVASAPRRFAP